MTLPDDPLLQSLGKLAREREDETAQLERRCRATPEEAGAADAGADSTARATAPFDDVERARLTEHVRRHLRLVHGAAPGEARRQRAAGADPEPRPPGQHPNLKIVRGDADGLGSEGVDGLPGPASHRRSGSRTAGPSVERGVRILRRAAVVVLPLCAAAAALLWLSPRAETVHDLPDYALELASAPATYRSGEPGTLAAPVELRAGEKLVLSLRPATAVREPIQTRVFLRQSSGSSFWPGTLEASPQGAVRLQLEHASTTVRGPAELVVLIGHAENPAPTDAGGLGWQRFRLPIVLR